MLTGTSPIYLMTSQMDIPIISNAMYIIAIIHSFMRITVKYFIPKHKKQVDVLNTEPDSEGQLTTQGDLTALAQAARTNRHTLNTGMGHEGLCVGVPLAIPVFSLILLLHRKRAFKSILNAGGVQSPPGARLFFPAVFFR